MIFIGLPMVFPLAPGHPGLHPQGGLQRGRREAQIESTVTGNAPETFIPDAKVALRLGWTHGLSTVGNPGWPG